MENFDMSPEAFRKSMMDAYNKTAARRSETRQEIFLHCKDKYDKTKVLVEKLKEKQKKLEEEIERLEQKQADRYKFLEETYNALKAE